MEMRDLWQGFNEHKHLSRLPEIARSISCLKKEKEKKKVSSQNRESESVANHDFLWV